MTAWTVRPVRTDEFTVEDQRQSVPWGGATPWGGSKHPMPPLKRRVMIRAMRRHGRLTLVRSVVSGVLTLGVLAVAAAGIVAVAPVGTQVVPASSVSSSDDSIGDLQLPTLALDD